MADSCSLAAHRARVQAESSYTDALAEAYAAEVGALPRPREDHTEIDERGAFVRQANAFATPFGEKDGEWKAAAGRYRLYWAKGCNWSNRPAIAISLLGLEDVITNILVGHTGESNKYGWGFPDQPGHKDPVTGAYFLSEFYHRAKSDYRGRATTPTLVDTENRIAVSNDYHRITNYIEVQFRPFQPVDAPDLYPKAFRHEIDQFNDWLFPHINNAHYRMAFCQSVEAYDEAFEDFYDSMDRIEERLSTNRFLFGDYITDSDIRFYVTLVRWDTEYFHNIGPQKHRIADYPNIYGYMKELFGIPAFRKNTYIEDIAAPRKDQGFFEDYQYRILTKVNFDELWQSDGSRAALSAHPEELYLRHAAGESAEEYQSEISWSCWNDPDPAHRKANDPGNSILDQDASINPLKGKI